eukprot:TRINITY_DN20103_c0_g1_i1.p1 TRINITY_DN20103_c0_g1~~TRINITY_DN20103_c0_g1_i1.p1  ORF type:complete len:363 (-),score=73.75 TRINITY_DN20103_c0_g1_i1:142-1230(-)
MSLPCSPLATPKSVKSSRSFSRRSVQRPQSACGHPRSPPRRAHSFLNKTFNGFKSNSGLAAHVGVNELVIKSAQTPGPGAYFVVSPIASRPDTTRKHFGSEKRMKTRRSETPDSGTYNVPSMFNFKHDSTKSTAPSPGFGHGDRAAMIKKLFSVPSNSPGPSFVSKDYELKKPTSSFGTMSSTRDDLDKLCLGSDMNSRLGNRHTPSPAQYEISTPSPKSKNNGPNFGFGERGIKVQQKIFVSSRHSERVSQCTHSPGPKYFPTVGTFGTPKPLKRPTLKKRKKKMKKSFGTVSEPALSEIGYTESDGGTSSPYSPQSAHSEESSAKTSPKSTNSENSSTKKIKKKRKKLTAKQIEVSSKDL